MADGTEGLNASAMIEKFQKFIEQEYLGHLMEKVRSSERSLVMDFAKLSAIEPTLAETLLDSPEEVLKAAKLSLERFDLEGEVKDFNIRFFNLPESHMLLLRNIRSKHLNKMFWFRGVVRQKSDVRPQVSAAKFECPSCGNQIVVLQLDKTFKEPTKCGCGRKGKFRLLEKELLDAQSLVLEEAPEDLDGGEQPKRINVLLKNDLVSPMSERKTNPGTKVVTTGQVKEVPITLRTGGQSIRFDIMIEANFVDSIEETLGEIAISEEEEKRILEIAHSPRVYEMVRDSIAPSIYGHSFIKEALAFQMVGGVRKTRTDGIVTRGDMHILLIGDPGAGKSQLLKRMAKVAPKTKYVSGKGVSGAGLTASVVKDEFLQGWSLEAGALVLANKGMCLIDELDKMEKEDRSAMHEALEQQTVTISKANIQATLRCETTVLAAANPKYGRFDPYGTIVDQIDLPPSLINRFDLIFPVKDIPDEKKDSMMAEFILKIHQNPDMKEAEIPTILLRKYFAYARRYSFPKLTDEAIEELKGYYLKMRGSGSGEGAVKSIPISARQLEGLLRLAEASAKLRLAELVTKEDAKRAIDLLNYCLRQIAVDEETGQIDIDRIASGITASQRGKLSNVREILSSLGGDHRPVKIEDIEKAAAEKGLDEHQVKEAIEKLKRSGDIFEPKRGVVQKMP